MNRITSGKKHKKKEPRLACKVNRDFMYKSKLKLKKVRIVLALLVCFLGIFIMNRKEILAYFTDMKSITNIFSINAEYTITFNANNGTGTMQPQ